MTPPLSQVVLDQGSQVYREIQQWRHDWNQKLSPAGGLDGAVLLCKRPQRFRRSSPLHGYYPFLFHTAFPEVPGEAVRELAVADRLHTQHLLTYDCVLDRTEPGHPRDLLLAQAEYCHTLKRLYPLFQPGHDFWIHYERSSAQSWRAVREERLRQIRRLAPFSFQRFRSLAQGKTALLKTFSEALCFLSERLSDLRWLSKSLDDHHLGLVLLDDLEDWKEDFTRGNFTFLLTRLIYLGGLEDRVLNGAEITLREVGSLLYGSGLAEKHLLLAEASFERAGYTAAGLSLPCWKAFNHRFAQHCTILRKDLAEIRRRSGKKPPWPVSGTNDQGAPIETAPGTEASLLRGTARSANISANISQCIARGARADPAHEEADIPSPGEIRQTLEICVRRGIAYLAKSQQPEGSYTLRASACTYMSPAGSPKVSSGATRLVIQALQSHRKLEPALLPVLSKASIWIRAGDSNRTLEERPFGLDACFPPEALGSEELGRWDSSFAPGVPSPPRVLFWANLHYDARRQHVRMPRLESFLLEGLRTGSPGSWNQDLQPSLIEPPEDYFQVSPLVTLLPVCLTLGEEITRTGAGPHLCAVLLNPSHSRDLWGAVTDTALRLICLLSAKYNGPETRFAAARLCRLQNTDGSWSANSFCRQGSMFYGSPEVTTAWCLLAMDLYRVATRQAGEEVKPVRSAASRCLPKVISQPGIPEFLSRAADRVIQRFSKLLPAGADVCREVYLGSWQGMPPHFLHLHEFEAEAGINLQQPARPPFLATSSRHLGVEVVLALVLALRCRLAGKPRTGLDQTYAAGAALWFCERLWPARPPWKLAGMEKLEWLWCQEQEQFLWEHLLPVLEGPVPEGFPQAGPAGSGLRCERAMEEPQGHSGNIRPHHNLAAVLSEPASRAALWPCHTLNTGTADAPSEGALLFLGRRFFELIRITSVNPEPVRLLAWDAFRIRRELGRAGFRG